MPALLCHGGGFSESFNSFFLMSVLVGSVKEALR